MIDYSDYDFMPEALGGYCDFDSIDDVYSVEDREELLQQIKSIDVNAEHERKTLFSIAVYGKWKPLGFDTLKDLFNSDLITSKCPQECYKQINRAKVELMINDGDFSLVGKMPASHLDMFYTISSNSKGSPEMVAKVKRVYKDLYVDKREGEKVTASIVKDYIAELYQAPAKSVDRKDIDESQDCDGLDTSFDVDVDEDDINDDLFFEEQDKSKSYKSYPLSQILEQDGEHFSVGAIALLMGVLREGLDSASQLQLSVYLINELAHEGHISIQDAIRELKRPTRDQEYTPAIVRAKLAKKHRAKFQALND